MLRGLRPQPRTSDCRVRMEGILHKDIRIKNAKARMQERGTKVLENIAEDQGEGEGKQKRRRLGDLEDQAMAEEDPDKLNEIFEQYRKEYQEARDDNEEDQDVAKRPRMSSSARMAEAPSGSGDPTQYEQMDVSEIVVEGADPWD